MWTERKVSIDPSLTPDDAEVAEACSDLLTLLVCSRLLVYNRTGAASGARAEEARYGAMYGLATMLMLGCGTLML